MKEKIQCLSQVETKHFDVSYLLSPQNSFPWKSQNFYLGFKFRGLTNLKRLQFPEEERLSAACGCSCNLCTENSNARDFLQPGKKTHMTGMVLPRSLELYLDSNPNSQCVIHTTTINGTCNL